MAPGNKERHPGYTGTIPKTKARNNCNVPQEAVTPTRRDMTTNLVTTSLDWVPVSEYNTRTNCNPSRKPTNNTSDQELTDLDNSISFESGFGRFVPVRPQPRALPLTVQNRDNIPADHNDDGVGSSISSHTLHHFQNGLIPHSNHAAAAVMIVNPTTPNAVTGNMSQPFNAQNQNRNNLTRTFNSTRNTFDANTQANNNNITPPISNSRTGSKTVNLMNNMYDQAQGSFNNMNENNQTHRESARVLGDAILSSCPDAASVERRLGQIREYIRVTSSLVDTMRNSEDEAFIEHTKEEYDELIEMISKLKESETKLQSILDDKAPENIEVPVEDEEGASNNTLQAVNTTSENVSIDNSTTDFNADHVLSKNINESNLSTNLKKVTNIENEQLNKTLSNAKDSSNLDEKLLTEDNDMGGVEIVELESTVCNQNESMNNEKYLNDELRKNILSCAEKVAMIEELKNKNNDSATQQQQDVMARSVSVQSNGSTYSDNELWQTDVKNKMELSQMRLSTLKQQQKRLLKYQAEAKQQLEEMKERQAQELHSSAVNDNFDGIQNEAFGYQQGSRGYTNNPVGVATTLPQAETLSRLVNVPELAQRNVRVHVNEEAIGGANSEPEEEESVLQDRGRALQIKLQELQLKKQHMEKLVTEFQKLQLAPGVVRSRNTYSSSGEDSAEEESTGKLSNKAGGSIKNEDPFKLMEIKAIKTALQKTKDLMRSVETFESEHITNSHEDSFAMSGHPNIHDNKSEGGWSNEDSVCRVRNTLPQRHKFTNEQQQLHHQQQQQMQHCLQQQQQQLQQQQQMQQQQQLQQQQLHHQQQIQHLQQQQMQHQQQHQQQQQHHQQQQQSHEANIASLQELAQELRMETEKIMGERARIKDMVSNKEVSRRQKKVNEEARESREGREEAVAPGPAERRQMQLRAILADKQRELEALLNKEKVLCAVADIHKNPDSRALSEVNQSYNSEQEEPESRSEQMPLDSQNLRENENYRGGGDSVIGTRSINTVPSRLESAYGSDTDSASRNKSNQRNRPRRRQTQERQSDENTSQVNLSVAPRPEPSTSNMAPTIAHNADPPSNVPYGHIPPQCWNGTKSNQDVRSNQFTQNSHSQTMERLLATPQMPFPPAMPYGMMLPYGMLSGGAGACGGCGCAAWGAWCWQQLALHQADIHRLRDQLNHLEERWRAETASHTLNNQVPPGNRANNYWDNFRSYSRQNLLSANSKTNADGHLGAGPSHNPHPLVERSHNTLHHTSSSTSPSITPKRNTNATTQPPSAPPSQTNDETNRHSRRNVAYERSLSFSSAPDVLNVNQNSEPETSAAAHSRNIDDNVTNININRQEPPPNFRNLNITNPIPEIIQSHANNLNNTANSKRKSSSKLPAKNSTNRRNYQLEFSQTSNVNIASTSETPNPNLASTSREVQEKATSKLFDLLRENVYSEVTTLIGVNESHPDFLIQLFRELQLISSEPLRQKVLQSIRNVLSQYSSIVESQNDDNGEDIESEAVTTTSEANYRECNSHAMQSTMQIDNKIVRFLLIKSEEIFTAELLETLASLILSSAPDCKPSKKRLLELLSKYEGIRVCDISGDIIENLPLFISGSGENEDTQINSDIAESSILQDVAGSLNLFSSSETQLHQLNGCPYDMWPGHVHMDLDGEDLTENGRCNQEGKVDLINCSEMHNGDLAEADQTCHEVADSGSSNNEASNNAESLPDVVDTDEVTPTEAEAEWLGLDRVPTRLHMEESSEKQKDLST